MAGKPPIKRANAESEKPVLRRSPEALVEWLRTQEPFEEDLTEVEDFPPEDIAVFDDYLDGENSQRAAAKERTRGGSPPDLAKPQGDAG